MDRKLDFYKTIGKWMNRWMDKHIFSAYVWYHVKWKDSDRWIGTPIWHIWHLHLIHLLHIFYQSCKCLRSILRSSPQHPFSRRRLLLLKLSGIFGIGNRRSCQKFLGVQPSLSLVVTPWKFNSLPHAPEKITMGFWKAGLTNFSLANCKTSGVYAKRTSENTWEPPPND